METGNQFSYLITVRITVISAARKIPAGNKDKIAAAAWTFQQKEIGTKTGNLVKWGRLAIFYWKSK